MRHGFCLVARSFGRLRAYDAAKVFRANEVTRLFGFFSGFNGVSIRPGQQRIFHGVQSLIPAAQTDAESFAVLEPKADGFRNYLNTDSPLSAEEEAEF